MIGLVKLIPDENIRYKTIIEECIYFADINPFNIYICEILLNPMSKYKLNSYTGDSLKLDKKNGWYDFDLVIMNPPYNTSGNTGTGNTLWQDFVKTALKSWIKQDGYLLCVHPPGWRKPNTERDPFSACTCDNELGLKCTSPLAKTWLVKIGLTDILVKNFIYFKNQNK